MKYKQFTIKRHWALGKNRITYSLGRSHNQSNIWDWSARFGLLVLISIIHFIFNQREIKNITKLFLRFVLYK